ncbi:MAG: RNA methyltransferase [Clostridia bacterium]|nr:RNA methyltransferase [Clostridia bacterium]
MSDIMLDHPDMTVFEGMTSISVLIKSIKAKNNDRKIYQILFDKLKIRSKRAELGFLRANADELGYELKVCEVDEINAITTGGSHGGIVALCTNRNIPTLSPDKILPNGIYYMIEGVEDPYNFGNSIRSLYAAGADGIILGKRNWMSAAGIVARASAGTSELISAYVSEEPTEAIAMFKRLGFTVVCAGIRDSEDLFEADLKRPLLVVIGGEKRGISRAILDMADRIIRIDYQNDFRGSLSTSAASAIFAFEINRKNRNL